MKLKELFENNLNRKSYRLILTYKGKNDRPPIIIRANSEEEATKIAMNVFKVSRVSFIEEWFPPNKGGVFKEGDHVLFVKPTERVKMGNRSPYDFRDTEILPADFKDVDQEGVIERIGATGNGVSWYDVKFKDGSLAINGQDLRLIKK